MDPSNRYHGRPYTTPELRDEQQEGIVFPLDIQEEEDGDRVVVYGFRRSPTLAAQKCPM